MIYIIPLSYNGAFSPPFLTRLRRQRTIKGFVVGDWIDGSPGKLPDGLLRLTCFGSAAFANFGLRIAMDVWTSLVSGEKKTCKKNGSKKKWLKMEDIFWSWYRKNGLFVFVSFCTFQPTRVVFRFFSFVIKPGLGFIKTPLHLFILPSEKNPLRPQRAVSQLLAMACCTGLKTSWWRLRNQKMRGGKWGGNPYKPL